MKRIHVLPLALILAALTPTAASSHMGTADAAKVAAGSYELDPSHASVAGRINHLGMSATTIRFAKLSGALTYDPTRTEVAQVDVTIDTASLSTDWEARDAELRGAAFFNTTKFPTARFTATSLTKVDATHAKVNGQLTLLGVTKPVQLDLTLVGSGAGMMGDQRVGFEAHATINRSDFGMKAYLPAIGDAVEITIDAEFTKK